MVLLPLFKSPGPESRPMTAAPRVAVWTVAIDAAPTLTWRQLSALLDDFERDRAARFVFERHRREYVAAHALKRLMLSFDHAAPPRSWAFETAPGGKPR